MSTTKNKLDTGLVRELAAILREADLGEVEVEHEGLRIRVSKPAAPVVQAAMAAPVAAPAAAAPSAAAPVTTTDAPPQTSDNAIKSPMVGTVYLSPEPGAKQFVGVGDKVKKGDTILLVEAMKTFNPVEADKAGTVKEIYVTDAQPVEYGEALILIE
ncbi:MULTISPECIES: acetyl-CoA carboxylase biotin carboxyl carrier protein [unclassified Hyphomonas]|jgi:acetyl-CoA carboxylase biotin carboxyl carrier protein|uniref:acetyl-CoA carboxylase biotin carboxyl carrier protein n=1 Tax=unclassified Hyphomonas TaxID=2630699 RepID=UPI000C94BD2A|nr:MULTISPECIES: acetyl-CoA carboxylase biotin carboxyl carrier protein [unclassified Hyphomonas]MAL42440.1 acetyl-CoA carboxylase, biotin carboxyl carrier protein [Hyphomonas sp.]RCL84811.1 MAG: acetyl-CoA carboxylase biotin carboxyl carrier protein [Hyphomonas sp.]HAW57260.1 acetyl-CoA carboxylase biotin carboxyl carrier protein [Hyphomonas sp.]HBN91338.1 acetyl-CoA carboxylase biotin carboxyl carrier protein [Hyphomonas sp.]HBT38220.1 acetyl-CoA carboxylase biotin carboxyl carrier protein [|tara:strand:+ start:6194 stop:6664 length:471 start_codon:yes stop_codon:yes gene_type:complete